MRAIKDDFPGTRFLWVLIGVLATCFAGIGALFVVELPQGIETAAYYVLLALAFVAAVLYNYISLRKGRWLLRRMKEEAEQGSAKER